MRPLLALVAIVKDEARSIRALLESVRGVADHVTILDTGSTDGTQDVIREVFAGRESLDYLREEPFAAFDKISDRRIIDFAATRNRVLDLEAAREDAAEFTLMLSGDEVLVGGAELRAFLEAKRESSEDAYCVTMQSGGVSWPFPRVLRTGSGRRYVFPIHEVPVGKEGQVGGSIIPGAVVNHDASDAARLYRRFREVDLPVLTYLAEQPVSTHEDHGSRARAVMNLAQTHDRLAEAYPNEPGSPWLVHKMAAMANYRRRAELEGDPEEVYFCLFHFLHIAEVVKLYSGEELVERLKPLAELDPRRPEVQFMLANLQADVDPRLGAFHAMEAVRVAREAKVKPLTMPVDTRVEWLALRLAAGCAQALKNPARARLMAEQGVAAGGPREIFAEYL